MKKLHGQWLPFKSKFGNYLILLIESLVICITLVAIILTTVSFIHKFLPQIDMRLFNFILTFSKWKETTGIRNFKGSKAFHNQSGLIHFGPNKPSLVQTGTNDIILSSSTLKDICLTNQMSQINDICDIYCHGDLLHTVELAHIFKDSKTFVDKKLKYHPKQVKANWEVFRQVYGKNATRVQITQFVEDNFDPEASQFDPWDPEDWTEDPAFLKKIRDPQLQNWARNIHGIWKDLGRKIKDDVRVNQDQYSLIYVSNPVIIPGGRFVEFYYWDSYWIILGLLHSEMNVTVKGMLLNFIELVENIGYVPNGGRIYYERSQPPLLIPMVKLYLDKTNDVQFLRANIGSLVKEFHFWLDQRTMLFSRGGKKYRVLRYNVEKYGPRPESYREDYELAQELDTEEERRELYYNLKSCAESGWDFSSRWFKSAPDQQYFNSKNNLTLLNTRNIIPVDLNAFFYKNAKLLQEFFILIENESGAEFYGKIAKEWKETINELFWDENLGSWFDLDLESGVLIKSFYPSNIVPLWAGAQQSSKSVEKVIAYLKSSGANDFPGGIPTSMLPTGQQWDFPNGWAPLQHLVIEALENSGSREGRQLAFEIAEKWVLNVYTTYLQSQPNAMFEKYDVTVVGFPGGGGEYDVVEGFGWSNGVIIDFLERYGSQICTCCSPVRTRAAFSSSSSFSASAATQLDSFNSILTNYNLMMALSLVSATSALSTCKVYS